MPSQKARTASLMSTPEDIEAQFYEALQSADIERLMEVWSDDDDIVCVHPGGPRVVGHAAIRATFDSIFSNGPVPAVPEMAHRVVHGGCAMHNVLERVNVETDDGPGTAWVIATNVYMKTERGWRMVAHHASPGSPRQMQEIAESPSILH